MEKGKIQDKGQNSGSPIRIGVKTPPAFLQNELVINCHTPQLICHVARPWLRAYIAQHVGQPLRISQGGGEATIDDWHLAHHSLVVGSTGSGKTRLAIHLLIEQIKQGCSAVVLDPKAQTINHLLAYAAEAGLSPDQVTVIDPRFPDGIPGWNPLVSGIPAAEAASDVVAVLAELNRKSWGPRLQDLMTNALIVIASHRLSLFELIRFLQRDDYREGLLRQYCDAPDQDAFTEAREYFLHEYGTWSRSARTEAAGPVINKLREFLRSSSLRSLLCAQRTTLDLADLWRRPGLVLVHLDRATLGEEGTYLLAGLFANLLFRTALRLPGPIPVVLSLDELATLEQFLGGTVTEVVTFARSLGLRLQASCQNLAQLSDGLRSALLANSAAQAFFRLGPADARFVGNVIAEGTEPRLSRLTAGLDQEDRSTGEAEMTAWRHLIRDGWGRPLRLRPELWEKARTQDLFATDPVTWLQRLASASGYRRLYVHAADSKAPVALEQYLLGIPVTAYRIAGPSPLKLVVRFPRPRCTSLEWWNATNAAHAWARGLQGLPVQQMALRVAGEEASVVRVTDVPDLPQGPREEAFRAGVMAATGQRLTEITATRQWRADQVEYVATGHRAEPACSGPTEPATSLEDSPFPDTGDKNSYRDQLQVTEDDDGSLA